MKIAQKAQRKAKSECAERQILQILIAILGFLHAKGQMD
jgi:hypothetical protein